MVAANYAKNTPIQSAHHIQASTTLIPVDWLSHNNHTEDKDQEIAGMSINVSAIGNSVNLQVCTSIKGIQTAT